MICPKGFDPDYENNNCYYDRGIKKKVGLCPENTYWNINLQQCKVGKNGLKISDEMRKVRMPRFFKFNAVPSRQKEDCSICLEPIDEEFYYDMICGHGKQFHTNCIFTYKNLPSNPPCPLCRSNFYINNLSKRNFGRKFGHLRSKNIKGTKVTYQKSTRKDKKWMTTTPSGKVVHWGDPKMKDYTQHHSKKRRKNYRSRHAGIRLKNGSRAIDKKWSPAWLSYNVTW